MKRKAVMKTGNIVKMDDFVTVVDDTLREQYGIEKGQVMFIMGESAAVVSDDDPYLFRKFFKCIEVGEDGYIAEDARQFGMNGLRLKPVGKRKQKELFNKLKEKFEVADEGTH
jgi:hypothetical protein